MGVGSAGAQQIAHSVLAVHVDSIPRLCFGSDQMGERKIVEFHTVRQTHVLVT